MMTIIIVIKNNNNDNNNIKHFSEVTHTIPAEK